MFRVVPLRAGDDDGEWTKPPTYLPLTLGRWDEYLTRCCLA